jgi:hypothetical protein
MLPATPDAATLEEAEAEAEAKTINNQRSGQVLSCRIASHGRCPSIILQ